MLTIIPLTLLPISQLPLQGSNVFNMLKEGEKKKKVTAVTRIRTWVTAATTQGPNH